MKMTIFLTSLEYPVPDSEMPRCKDLGNPYSTKEEYWEQLKDECYYLRNMVDNMRTAPKRVRRTPSGNESPMERTVRVSGRSPQLTGSSSQSAPTSAPPQSRQKTRMLSIMHSPPPE